MKNYILLTVALLTSFLCCSQKIIHNKPVVLSDVQANSAFTQIYVIGPNNVIAKAPRSTFAEDLQSVIDNGGDYSGNSEIRINTTNQITAQASVLDLKYDNTNYCLINNKSFEITTPFFDVNATSIDIESNNQIDVSANQIQIEINGNYGNDGDILVNNSGYLEWQPKAGQNIVVTGSVSSYDVQGEDYTVIYDGDGFVNLEDAEVYPNRIIRIVARVGCSTNITFINTAGDSATRFLPGVTLLQSDGINWYQINNPQ